MLGGSSFHLKVCTEKKIFLILPLLQQLMHKLRSADGLTPEQLKGQDR